MKRYSFLPKLKYFAIVFAALVICVAACYHPLPKLEAEPVSNILVNSQPLLHVGKGQPSTSTLVPLSHNRNIFYRIRKDEMILDVTYKSPMAEEITLRLYDELGALQHIEKLDKNHIGLQHTLAFSHLKAGMYELQLTTQHGVELSQAISLHHEVQM